MNHLPEWLTIKEAAALVQRDISRVYRWVREGRMVSEERSTGVIVVRRVEVLELESRMRRRKNNKTRRD